jgi:hypothetical protein
MAATYSLAETGLNVAVHEPVGAAVVVVVLELVTELELGTEVVWDVVEEVLDPAPSMHWK